MALPLALQHLWRWRILEAPHACKALRCPPLKELLLRLRPGLFMQHLLPVPIMELCIITRGCPAVHRHCSADIEATIAIPDKHTVQEQVYGFLSGTDTVSSALLFGVPLRHTSFPPVDCYKVPRSFQTRFIGVEIHELAADYPGRL